MYEPIDFNIAYPLSFEANPNKPVYIRTNNPQCLELEARLQSMYGAERVVVTGNCMEAFTTMLDWQVKERDKILIDKNAYAELRFWLRLIDRYDVKTIDMLDLEDVKANIKGASLVCVDNPNRFGEWYDISSICEIAHEQGAFVVVDNSSASIYYSNPITEGADMVVESYSKYIVGSGDAMAGVWVLKKAPNNRERFKAFLEWRGRGVHPMVINAINKGLDTLSIRMEHSTASAKKVIASLGEIPYLYCGCTGTIILPMENPKEVAYRLKNFEVCTLFGAVYSTCTPSYRPDLYAKNFDYLRLSIGLEPVEELIDDLRNALEVN